MKPLVALVFSLLFGFSLFFVSLTAKAQGTSPPKCEKCYRGPDGKIVCEPVACPK